MSSKTYYKNLDKRFIKYWEHKSKSRIKYSFLQSLYFGVPFSIFMMVMDKGFQNLFTLNFLLRLSLICFFYYFITYFITFSINEKRYQKIKKAQQNFDN